MSYVLNMRYFIFLFSTCIGAQSIVAQQICEEPISVPQIVWRSGLQEPIGQRIGLPTTHVVIHHSSDPNLVLDDYTPLVRNIYQTHTQSNGWDDVGYNYLIDPKGVIYKGRDPQGVASQDEVQGAHMCNKNENTMGICMIGNFTNVLPTRAAMRALYLLAGWKVAKDHINPYGEHMHGIGPTEANLADTLLAQVCGHRDGCASHYTECPGELFHSTLNEVRDSINLYSGHCELTALQEPSFDQFKLFALGDRLYAIPASDFEYVKIYTIKGQLLSMHNFEDSLSINNLPSNELLLAMFEGKEAVSYKLKLVLD